MSSACVKIILKIIVIMAAFVGIFCGQLSIQANITVCYFLKLHPPCKLEASSSHPILLCNGNLSAIYFKLSNFPSSRSRSYFFPRGLPLDDQIDRRSLSFSFSFHLSNSNRNCECKCENRDIIKLSSTYDMTMNLRKRQNHNKDRSS